MWKITILLKDIAENKNYINKEYCGKELNKLKSKTVSVPDDVGFGITSA